jgi:rubredoxin
MNYKDITKMRNCPECGANWVDKPIPKEYREYYSPPYFFSRVIGVEPLGEDRIAYWLCPDCEHQFPRGMG